MPLNINCTKFTDHGYCVHPSAPKPMLGSPTCIIAYPNRKDPRVVAGCALQQEHTRPVVKFGTMPPSFKIAEKF